MEITVEEYTGRAGDTLLEFRPVSQQGNVTHIRVDLSAQQVDDLYEQLTARRSKIAEREYAKDARAAWLAPPAHLLFEVSS